MDLSIVVPVKNESSILDVYITELEGYLRGLSALGSFEIIVVDNGSNDGSGDVLESLSDKIDELKVISLAKGNIGKAMRTGLRESLGDYVLIMPIDEIDYDFFTWAWKFRHEYSLILGSKRLNPVLNGQTPYRRFLTWGLNSMLSLLTEYIGADTHGCKLMRREDLIKVDSRCVISRGQYDTELTIRAVRSGLPVAEVPVVYVEKRSARDFMLKKIVRNVVDLFRLARALRNEPFVTNVRFHRWARADVIASRCLASAGECSQHED